MGGLDFNPSKQHTCFAGECFSSRHLYFELSDSSLMVESVGDLLSEQKGWTSTLPKITNALVWKGWHGEGLDFKTSKDHKSFYLEKAYVRVCCELCDSRSTSGSDSQMHCERRIGL